MAKMPITAQWTDRPWKVAAWVTVHTFGFVGAVQLTHWYVTGSAAPLSALMRFDAEHYAAIANEGYVPFRQAFFPLMPWLWSLLGGSVASICILNGCAYLVSLCCLAWKVRANFVTLALFLCIPNAVFFFSPYSEALFFACATMVIIGLWEGSKWKLLLGLFLCSITRPTFTTLLPALLFALKFSETPTREIVFRKVLECVLVSVAGITLVSWAQHADTGDWLGFYTAQSGWGNKPGWLTFPFGSWGGNDIVRLDAVAMFFGLFISGALLWHALAKIELINVPRSIRVLSFTSLISVTLIVLVLRHGQLFSLNRFIFCTPYFLVLLHVARSSVSWIPRMHWMVMFLLLEAFFALFGSFVHIQNFLWFTGLIAILMLLLASFAMKCKHAWLEPVLIGLAFVCQVGFAVKFLNGGWVA